jgi:phage/plasmid-associated DNA primase
MRHFFNIICLGRPELFRYMERWAGIIQRADYRNCVAVLLKSHCGAGKDTFFSDPICVVLGEYGLANVVNSEDVLGTFNSLLEEKKLIVMDECKDVQQKAFKMEEFKGLLTSPRVNINEKGVKQRNVQNISNFLITANAELPIKIEAHDRRFLVIDVSNEHAEPEITDPEREAKKRANADYFGAMAEEIAQPEFYPALYTHFMGVDMTGFNPRAIPETGAKLEAADASTQAFELFLQEHAAKLTQDIQVKDLYPYYRRFCEDSGFRAVAINQLFIRLKPYGVEKRLLHGKALVRFTQEGLDRFKDFLEPELPEPIAET